MLNFNPKLVKNPLWGFMALYYLAICVFVTFGMWTCLIVSLVLAVLGVAVYAWYMLEYVPRKRLLDQAVAYKPDEYPPRVPGLDGYADRYHDQGGDDNADDD